MAAADVTFCFLVTQDLVKEELWRHWFARLQALDFKFNIITHISPAQKARVQSDWLRQTFLPDTSLCETAWGWLMRAELAMYTYAVAHHPAAWYTLHSESCVPLVAPETFIAQFQAYKTHTFLNYQKAWWTPTPVPCDRANLHLLPPDYHWAHPQWSILCHEDLSQLVALAQADPHLTHILSSGHTADESFLAVYLYKINNFKNVIPKATTLVDWKRGTGASPHTFLSWTEVDKAVVAELQAANAEKKHNYLFLRKIGAAFPDEVLRSWI
jgi:hypothetical protein